MAQDLIEFIKENILLVFILGMLSTFAIFYITNNNGYISYDEFLKINQTNEEINTYNLQLEGSGLEFENLSKGADPEKSQSGVSKETVAGAFEVVGQGFNGIKNIYKYGEYVLGPFSMTVLSVFIGLTTFTGVLLALRHIFGKY